MFSLCWFAVHFLALNDYYIPFLTYFCLKNCNWKRFSVAEKTTVFLPIASLMAVTEQRNLPVRKEFSTASMTFKSVSIASLILGISTNSNYYPYSISGGKDGKRGLINSISSGILFSASAQIRSCFISPYS